MDQEPKDENKSNHVKEGIKASQPHLNRRDFLKRVGLALVVGAGTYIGLGRIEQTVKKPEFGEVTQKDVQEFQDVVGTYLNPDNNLEALKMVSELSSLKPEELNRRFTKQLFNIPRPTGGNIFSGYEKGDPNRYTYTIANPKDIYSNKLNLSVEIQKKLDGSVKSKGLYFGMDENGHITQPGHFTSLSLEQLEALVPKVFRTAPTSWETRKSQVTDGSIINHGLTGVVEDNGEKITYSLNTGGTVQLFTTSITETTSK